LAQFGKRRADARRRYRQFVLDGIGNKDLWAGLRQQIYLGDEKFVRRMQAKAGLRGDELSIPHAQRRAPAPSIAALAKKHRDRDDAIAAAYGTGAYSYREIAEHFGLHLATVGRVVRGRMLQSEN
jgi:putative transposase